MPIHYPIVAVHFHPSQIMFLILHIEKGTPFDANDQGRSRFLTAWEQIDHGEDFSSSKKFLTIVPIIVLVDNDYLDID